MTDWQYSNKTCTSLINIQHSYPLINHNYTDLFLNYSKSQRKATKITIKTYARTQSKEKNNLQHEQCTRLQLTFETFDDIFSYFAIITLMLTNVQLHKIIQIEKSLDFPISCTFSFFFLSNITTNITTRIQRMQLVDQYSYKDNSNIFLSPSINDGIQSHITLLRE